jgi:hypothetical protein
LDTLLNQKLEKLIKGQAVYTSKNLGFNLLISRMQKKYAANAVNAEMNSCLKEVNQFLEKYRSILTEDIEAIKKI